MPNYSKYRFFPLLVPWSGFPPHCLHRYLPSKWAKMSFKYMQTGVLNPEIRTPYP